MIYQTASINGCVVCREIHKEFELSLYFISYIRHRVWSIFWLSCIVLHSKPWSYNYYMILTALNGKPEIHHQT